MGAFEHDSSSGDAGAPPGTPKGSSQSGSGQPPKLGAVLRVCAWCRKVQQASGEWIRIEALIPGQPGALVTHTVCPDCEQKWEKHKT